MPANSAGAGITVRTSVVDVEVPAVTPSWSKAGQSRRPLTCSATVSLTVPFAVGTVQLAWYSSCVGSHPSPGPSGYRDSNQARKLVLAPPAIVACSGPRAPTIGPG